MNYYSQCGEDKWIEENLHPPMGNFCEVGAFDGVKSSNTKHFEEIGWGGLCIEADPFVAGQCCFNRKCWSMCATIGRNYVESFARFHINPDDHGLSGVAASGRQIITPVVRLDDALNTVWIAPNPNLYLLSIDTEGTELDVWSTIGNWRPHIVIMEYQTCDNPPKDKEIGKQMAYDMYEEVHRTQYNIIYKLL